MKNSLPTEWDRKSHIFLYKSSHIAKELLSQWEGKKEVDQLDIRNGLKALLEIKIIENRREGQALWDKAYPHKWLCPECKDVNSSKIPHPGIIPNVKPIDRVMRKGMDYCRKCGTTFYLKKEQRSDETKHDVQGSQGHKREVT